MGFNSVYRTLMEVFPEIDTRMLKAVAIEHSQDSDVAAEAVLTEVIPYLSHQRSMAVNYPPQHVHSRNISDREAEHEEAPVLHSSLRPDCYRSCSSSTPKSIVIEHPRDETRMGIHAVEKAEMEHRDSEQEDSRDLKVPNTGDTVDDGKTADQTRALSYSHIFNYLKRVSVSRDSESEEDESDSLESSFQSESDFVSSDSDIDCYKPDGITTNEKCNTEDEVITARPADLSAQEHSSDSPCGSLRVFKYGNLVSECEHPDGISTTVKGDDLDESTSDSILLRTSHVCDINSLEEIIEDAKSNKKTLFSAMELVMNMMREVELQEKAAEQAKEEAENGGTDILEAVEELKKTLTRAREANNMHAGEVFGEKAILSTEMKELQNRLICVSEEKNKSLAILDEMRETLQNRRATAEEVMKVAKQQKLEKEESALKALSEQNAIMAKVVEESKILQQEAAENSKLNDFVTNRGRVVDSLQGEISVICKDVLMLKEKFDSRVPLSQSICSSQTSCILASSGSFLRSTTVDLIVDTPKTLENRSGTATIDDESSKERLDDIGWDICDSEPEMDKLSQPMKNM